MIFLLLLCVVSLTALADDVTVIPRNGSGKMPANGDEVTLEGPNVDFSHVPPNLAFTLRNDSATSFEMSVTVNVYWNSSPKCPGRYAKTWTGTMLGGATEIKIYDADLDQYAFSVGPTMCEATSFGAKAEVTKSWPSWLNDCDGLLWHTLPDGSSPRENRHWRQSWLDLVASDSHTDSKARVKHVKEFLGVPTAEIFRTDSTSLIYVAQATVSRKFPVDSATCSFQVEIPDGPVALKHMSHAEQADALKPIEAALAQREAEEEKSEVAAAEHRRKLAADRKKKDQERAAELAKIRAAEQAETASKVARAKAACRGIYASTIDKRTGDLTVRETEQVRACQTLGYYPPE